MNGNDELTFIWKESSVDWLSLHFSGFDVEMYEKFN